MGILAVAIGGVVAAIVTFAIRRWRINRLPLLPVPPRPERSRRHVPVGRAGSDVEVFAERLCRTAWGPRDSNLEGDLALGVASISRATTNSQVVDALLRHARLIAPGFNVPFNSPQVIVGRLNDAAGLFSESDGRVTLTVSDEFFDNRAAASAILCHELSHYVLAASGIREANTLSNERMTDVGIFVLGLGDIFLNGYKSAHTQYRRGHTLGYLSAAEYDAVDRLVFSFRLSGKLQSTDSDARAARFRRAIPNAGVRESLLEQERKRSPQLSPDQLIDHVLERFYADRR
jgi:hypothetical protein